MMQTSDPKSHAERTSKSALRKISRGMINLSATASLGALRVGGRTGDIGLSRAPRAKAIIRPRSAQLCAARRRPLFQTARRDPMPCDVVDA